MQSKMIRVYLQFNAWPFKPFTAQYSVSFIVTLTSERPKGPASNFTLINEPRVS